MSERFSEEEINLRLIGEADKYADWQFDVLAPYIGGNVLELGGGIGTITQRILVHPSVTSCTVTEINRKNFEVLRKMFDSRCKLALLDIGKCVPASFVNKFDTVVSVNVMEHVRDDHAFFRNCCKCLKKGGKIVTFVPAMNELFGSLDESVFHVRRYEREDLVSLANKNGLDIIRLFHMNFVGALGWFYHGRILRVRVHPKTDLVIYNRLVPLMRKIEEMVPVPFGLSLVLVAEKKNPSDWILPCFQGVCKLRDCNPPLIMIRHALAAWP